MTALQKRFDQQTKPKAELSFRYIDDDNVNNAPKVQSRQGWQLPTAEQASGFGYFAKAQKTQPIKDHLTASISLSMQGKYYWNNDAYNDNIAEVGSSLGWANAQKTIAINPYYQKRHFSGDAYSNTVGMRLTASRFFYPNINTAAGLDIGKKSHTTRDFLDGYHTQLTARLSKTKDGWHSYIGTSLNKESTKEPSETYREAFVLFGVQKIWGNFGTSHELSIGQRAYQGVDFFNIKRSDKRYITEHSLWHNKLYYKGYTPSLNVRYESTNSNHFAYDNHSTQVFISVQKRH